MPQAGKESIMNIFSVSNAAVAIDLDDSAMRISLSEIEVWSRIGTTPRVMLTDSEGRRHILTKAEGRGLVIDVLRVRLREPVTTYV
jgi:hypothetical protein